MHMKDLINCSSHCEEDNRHPILNIELIREIVGSFMPELLDNSKKSKHVLDRIEHYLFKQPYLKADALIGVVIPEFQIALYGLKAILKEHNLNIATWTLETNQEIFARFIDLELNS